MDESYAIRRYEQAAALLPLRWQQQARQLAPGQMALAEELRLRAGRPMTVLLPEGEVVPGPSDLPPTVTQSDLEQLCDAVTDYSRYAAGQDPGHRPGVPVGHRDLPGRGTGGHGGGAGDCRGLRCGAGVPAPGPGGVGAAEVAGMKKVILLLLLLWALTVPAWGTELPREVRDALPAAAEDITEHMDDSASFSEGLSLLWERACGYLTDALRESISGGVLLLAAAVLCALTEECMDAAGGKVHFVPMAGALAVTLAAAGSVRTMMGLGQETVEELNTFSKALLPTLSAAVAASGGILSASVRQVATVFFVDLLLSLIRGLLLPLVYFYVAAAAADAMLPGRHLAGISTAIRKGTVWLLTGALALFTLYLTVSGAAAGSADTVTARLARGAVGVLPVVGSILADAADTVLAGAGAVRNTVGVAGLLAVLAVCLLPLVRLGTQYLVYKAAAFLAGVLGAERLTGLIDALGGAFGLIFGMTGACGLLLLISISSALGVVTG